MVATLPDDVHRDGTPPAITAEGVSAHVVELLFCAGGTEQFRVIEDDGLGVATRPGVGVADRVFDIPQDAEGFEVSVGWCFHGRRMRARTARIANMINTP
jgi:hypothetical protein